MGKTVVNILKYLAFLGLGVFLVWWSLHQIPEAKWTEFKTAFATARYSLLIPVFFILSTSHILRAVRWRMLMQPMGYHPSLINTFFAVMIGYLANLAVPRLGEVLKCTILAKYETVPAEKLVGTIVAERAFDVFCLLIVFVLAFALQYDEIGHYGASLVNRFFKSKSGSLNITNVAITIAIIVAIVILIRIFFRTLSHTKAVITIKSLLQGVWHGIISVKDLKHKLPFLLATAGIWTMYLLGTWIGFNATSGTAGLPFEVAVSTLAFASIGMILTPGGIGAYAFFLARVLEENGVPFEIGYANGTLQWFAQFLIIIFVGFISLGLLPYFNKKRDIHAKA